MYNTIQNENGINFFTIERPMYNRFEVWCVEYRGGHPFANITLEGNEMKKDEISEEDRMNGFAGEDDKFKPFLVLPHFYATELIKAFVEHLDRKGVKTKDHNLLEGENIATKEHLKDMKQIAFKLLKIDPNAEN